jgi:hypothetical protein
MPEFDALGRDVLAAANSTFETDAAEAVKRLWRWAGLEDGDNPNHLWTVSAEATEDGFAVTATVKDRNVYVPEVTPAPPASPEEIARSNADVPVDEPAPEAAPAELVPGAVPEVAPVDAAAVPVEAPVVPETEAVAAAPEVATETPEAAPVDPPVAASSTESSTPLDSTPDAAAS